MEFGKDLQNNIYDPWRLEYVAYDDIKQDLKTRQQDHEWNDHDEKDFETTLRQEAEKVDFFISRKQREIESRLAYCERSLVKQQAANSLYESMADALTEILMDLNDLSKFTRYNALAIQKLINQHDEYTNYNNQLLLVDIIRSRSLDKQRFDVALVKVSTLHDLCQLHIQARKQGNTAITGGDDQSALESATAKYWIHPDNVTEVKAILLFHLPTVKVLNAANTMEGSNRAISSVYFDNPNFDLYNGCLQLDEGAEAIRIRWYGTMESKGDIFIERNTHHATWLNGASVKDRIRLDADKVDAFINGTYTADQYKADLASQGINDEGTIKTNYFIASGIQKSIQEKQLEPVVRVSYHRTRFQISGDNRLCISLDTDMTFVREDGLQQRRKGSWRRPDLDYPIDNHNNLKPTEVNKFPFAVLETKLQTQSGGQDTPSWLTRLLESNLVHEVPRFSKYLQGAARFWSPRLALLPWWLSQLDVLDIRHDKQSMVGNSRTKSMIDGKYRMGYLESQLERASVLKRVESTSNKKQPLIRNASTRSVRGLPPTIRPTAGVESASVNIPMTFISPAVSHHSLDRSGTGGNPFDDPIWSQHDNNISFGALPALGHHGGRDSVASSAIFNRRTMISHGRLTAEFQDNASTEFLIVPHRSTTRSSYLHQMEIPSTKDEKDHHFHQDINVIEKGGSGKQEPYHDEEKNVEDEEEKKRLKREERQFKRLVKEGATVEPKVFFANERTFIHWLHFSATLMSVALTLMNFGDGINKIIGGIFFGIAFIFITYATLFYRWRAWRITNKPHLRFDDVVGPPVLCVLVLAALITNFVIRFNSPSTTNTYLGTNNNTTTTSNTTDSGL